MDGQSHWTMKEKDGVGLPKILNAYRNGARFSCCLLAVPKRQMETNTKTLFRHWDAARVLLVLEAVTFITIHNTALKEEVVRIKGFSPFDSLLDHHCGFLL